MRDVFNKQLAYIFEIDYNYLQRCVEKLTLKKYKESAGFSFSQ